MAEPEKQKQSPQEPREEREKIDLLGSDRALSVQIQGLSRSLGEVQPLSEELGIMEIREAQENFKQVNVFQSLSELMRVKELELRQKALQFLNLRQLKDMNDPRRRLDFLTTDRKAFDELAVTNQAVTYFVYLPAVINQVKTYLDLFDRCTREMIPNLPLKEREFILEQRRLAVVYLQSLRNLMDERIRYANVRKIDFEIAETEKMPQQKDHKDDLLKRREEIIGAMFPESQRYFQEDRTLQEQYLASTPKERQQRLKEWNKKMNDFSEGLEHRLIAVLKGNPDGENIPGAPKDFLPQRLYLQTMQLRYEQLQAIQVYIAQNHQDWSETDRREAQTQLGVQRRQCISEISAVTQQLVAHQVAMTEMTSIQEQFAGHYDLLMDPGRPFTTPTDKEFLDRTAKSINGAKDFHIGRLEEMLKTAGMEFDPNGLMSLKDASRMELVKGVDGLSRFMRNAITFLMPESKQKEAINSWIDKNLPLCITESLDSGVGPGGKPMTREQKLQLIRDTLVRFKDGGSAARFQETVTVLRSLPSAGNFVAEEVQQDVLVQLQNQRITRNVAGTVVNVGGKDVTINGSTAYVLTLRQLKQDNEAFAEQYGSMLQELEDVVDIRLGLKAEANRIAESWKVIAESILGAAVAGPAILWAAGGAITTFGGIVLWKISKPVLRALTRPIATAQAIGRLPGRLASKITPDRIALGGMAALQTYRLWEDFLELGDTQKSVETQRTRMVTELRSAGFEADPAGQEKLFTYADGDLKITVNLEDIRSALAGQTMAQGVQMGGDAVELAYILNAIRLGTSAARAVPVVIAVEAVVETAVYGVNQEAQRRFIKRCPSWLLAKLNMQQAIKDSRYGMLATASEWMLTDATYWRGENVGENKREIREKMIFGLLHEELADLPELIAGLYHSGPHPKEMQKFEKGDFRDVFLKFYYAVLFRQCNGALSLDQIKEGRIGGFNPLPARTPDIPQMDVRKAIREALALTIEQNKEREYVEAVRRREEYSRGPKSDPQVIGLFDQVIDQFGQRTSLGQKISELPPPNDGRTRMQGMADTALKLAETNSYILGPSPQLGLKEGLDLSNSSSIFERCIRDPAVRIKLQTVKPRTIEEREGGEGRLWHDWKFWTEPLGKTFSRSIYNNTVMGSYGNIDFDRSHAISATDNVRAELRRKPIAPKPTLLSILGASGDEPTLDYAQDRISSDSIDLIDNSRSIDKLRSSLILDQETGRRLYPHGSTLVFTQSGRGLDQSLPIERLKYQFDHVDQKKFGPPRAMFLEHRFLRASGHRMVLATCVFGDLAKKEVLVMQCAMASSMLARSSNDFTTGSLHPVSLEEMRGKPGIEQMLELALAAQKEQEREEELARSRRAQEQLAKEQHEGKKEAEKSDPLVVQENFEVLLRQAKEDRFSLITDRWNDHARWMKYVDSRTGKASLIKLQSYSEGPGMSAETVPKDGRRPAMAEEEAVRFVVEGKDGLNWTIKNNEFMAQENVTEEQKELIRRVVTTPIEGDHRQSLLQVISLFPYDNFVSSWRKNHFYAAELTNELLPLYKRTPTYQDGQNFLRDLLSHLQTEGGAITAASKAKVVQWFKDNKERYKITQ